MLKHRDVSVVDWPDVLKGLFHTINVESALASDASHCHVVVAPSTIKREDAGDGLFVAMVFNEGDVIGSLYGGLVYEDISKRSQNTKSYGEGLMATTVHRFQHYGRKIVLTGALVGDPGLEFSVLDNKGNEKRLEDIYLVPAPFFACSKIKDYKYHVGDREIFTDERSKRSQNVRFEQAHIRKRRDLTRTTIFLVRAIRPIAFGEELFSSSSDDTHVQSQ